MTERENILIDALISSGHIAEQARTAMEKLKAENTELRHRAEVAEKALNSACFILAKNYYTDGKEDWAKRGAECATFYREQAERRTSNK